MKFCLMASMLAGLPLLNACSTPAMPPMAAVRAPNQVLAQSVAPNAELEAQYVITAQALIDKIVTTRNPNDHSKIRKDFAFHIRSLNRYSLNKLADYGNRVLHQNLQPNQDPAESAVHILMGAIAERLLVIHSRFFERAVDMLLIVTAPGPGEQAQLLLRFESNLRRLPKVDTRELLAIVERNDGELFPPAAPLTQQLRAMMQEALNR